MKEVKKEVKEVKKTSLLDLIFSQIKMGRRPSEISKDLSISKQQLQYYLTKLKKDGSIKKVGYGVWQTSKNRVANSCRGHGFMWHIKLPQEIKVWEQILIKKKIKFKKINADHTFQINFKDRRVWLSKKSIVLYDIKSYFGQNAVESKKYAMFELKLILDALESKLGTPLKTKQGFQVKTTRQHYALVKNALAIQCNKNNERLNVYNENGLWFIIDNSFNLDEAETIHPKSALPDNIGIQKYFNEHKELKFEMTPKKVLTMIQGVAANQEMFNQNFSSHVEAIKTLSATVKDLKIQNKVLTDTILKLQQSFK
jgi:DNA-binding Lrp family transcriptional regulator